MNTKGNRRYFQDEEPQESRPQDDSSRLSAELGCSRDEVKRGTRKRSCKVGRICSIRTVL